MFSLGHPLEVLESHPTCTYKTPGYKQNTLENISHCRNAAGLRGRQLNGMAILHINKILEFFPLFHYFTLSTCNELNCCRKDVMILGCEKSLSIAPVLSVERAGELCCLVKSSVDL